MDVNFLVGENSTGKTSILALLKLLSPADFWLQSEFDLRKVGLGSFRDVVSIGSNDNSYFSIGTVFDKKIPHDTKHQKNKAVEEHTSETMPVVLVMTFTEKEGMPKISSISSYKNGNELHIKYIGNTIRYKYANTQYNCSAEHFASFYMRDWVKKISLITQDILS